MSYIGCRFCKKTHIGLYSDSWIYGCCRKCRRKLIPDHIIEKQYKRFLNELNRKRNDRKEVTTKGNT